MTLIYLNTGKIGLVEKAHRGFKREQPNRELAL